ncbi:hypothetical protein EZ449_08595 [Pedobacter frigidisoli]|uniref:Uncharacterized protein n=1 Tax=Pedobacter frigidisoli TaxID=2530455 RepID=A0A4R0P1Q6_9SPHI|nr:hypothetical protein EZ449_08595 [Pedobacter frigidisoli]
MATLESIRIDKLNLNLGNVPLDKLVEVMKEQIHNQLYKKLNDYKLSNMSDELTLTNKHSSLFKNVGSFSKQAFRNEQGISNKVETHVNDYEALVFYCETGTKPWWVSSEVNFEPNKILLNIYKYDKPLFVQLINAVKEDSVVYHRLKQLINKSIFFHNYLIFNEYTNFLSYFISMVNIDLYNLILEIWLSKIHQKDSEITYQNLETWLLNFVKEHPQLKVNIADIVRDYLTDNISAKQQQVTIMPLSNFLTSKIKNNDDEPKHRIMKLKKSIQQKTPSKKLVIDSLMIENAGLVIFHPFIQPLFRQLQLVNEDGFLNDLAQQKAIVYLHYLIYNELPEDESLLLLNKILCGAEPEMIIEFNNIAFSAEDLAESNELKKAIIGHWNGLKLTSPAGLTETFILRNGILNYKDGSWNLAVEKKGFDILFDQLPWGFSIIKLPWNKYLIQVNW